MARYDAVVVGAGPNGLSAALRLARAGPSVKVFEAQPTVGGGARSAALTREGFVHDVCSAIHPLAAASPFFQSLELHRHGVELVQPDAPLAHPLDGGEAVTLERSVEATAAQLGEDEGAYLKLMRPLVARFAELLELTLSPLTRPRWRSPLALLRFALAAVRPARAFAESTFRTEKARALFGGCAAHALSPLETHFTSAAGTVLLLTGHAVGWPLIRGGTQRLSDALAALLRAAGGELELGHPVRSLEELPPARLVLFDTHAQVMAKVCGGELPPGYRRQLAGFRLGPGVFKVDYALDGPMPWAASACARAATVHVGGTLAELAASEAAPARGQVAERPYVLVAQQSLFDASRAPPGQHTLWAYCHVPRGAPVDMTAALEAQLERFAPGFSRRVLARHARGPAELEADNASYVGGDISGGAMDGSQLLFRPVVGRPYVTPNPRVLLCSSSTPPGPGVHGMCGYWAAEVALERLRGGV